MNSQQKIISMTHYGANEPGEKSSVMQAIFFLMQLDDYSFSKKFGWVVDHGN